MSGRKHASRLNLSFCANQVAKKTGIHSWFGVQNVLMNDKRWKTLNKSQKILPELLLTHCEFSGLASGTINRLHILIGAAERTNNNMGKMVKLLTKPNEERKFTEIIMSKRNARKNVLLNATVSKQTDSPVKSQLRKAVLKHIPSKKRVYCCRNVKKDLQIAVYESLKWNKMHQEQAELMTEPHERGVNKTCAVCTFDNHMIMSYCEICGFTLG